MSPFKTRVLTIICAIPKGNVMSYGQVALYAGLPRAAREVGWILNQHGGDIPWWRVINNSGRITIRGAGSADRELQRKLLQTEGVAVSEDFTVAMDTYRFVAPPELLRTFQLDDAYIERIIAKYHL
jgi:methylated-DNA-protein-cysteine methyltransferase-like protein